MKIDKEVFLINNTEKNTEIIYLYKMRTSKDLEVQIISWGATLYKILLPSVSGPDLNILLTLQNREDYLHNTLFAGSSLGPVAGRIENARLPVNDKIYRLSQNDGTHNLHGGIHNISFLNWHERSFRVENDTSYLTLSCHLDDGIDGYPGNRNIIATFSLDETGKLSLLYEALSDANTYFNLSNHAYFNLSGDYHISGLLQRIFSPADKYTYNNEEHICLGMEAVQNTPFDFHKWKSLQDTIAAYPNNNHILSAHGYNHALVLPLLQYPALRHALSLSDAKGLHTLSIYTDAPCVVLYSAGYIDNTVTLYGNVSGMPSCAIALEAQDLPNAPWVQTFPYHVTKTGELYSRKIVYLFT